RKHSIETELRHWLVLPLDGAGTSADFAVASTLIACAASRLPFSLATSAAVCPSLSLAETSAPASIRTPIIGGLLWLAATINGVTPLFDLALTSAPRSIRPLAIS